jgi:hypothetical protein
MPTDLPVCRRWNRRHRGRQQHRCPDLAPRLPALCLSEETFLDGIEHIEVVRRLNAASYGSNLFTSAVNVITRRAVPDRGFNPDTGVGTDAPAEGFVRIGGNFTPLENSIERCICGSVAVELQ